MRPHLAQMTTNHLPSGVAWTIWLRMQFLVCVSMTASIFINISSKYDFKCAVRSLVFYFFECLAELSAGLTKFILSYKSCQV